MHEDSAIRPSSPPGRRAGSRLALAALGLALVAAPVQSRTVVDVRSRSRIGRADMGTNARRGREYFAGVSS